MVRTESNRKREGWWLLSGLGVLTVLCMYVGAYYALVTTRRAPPRLSDLSILKEMPLEYLFCDFKPERDTEVLRSITTLVEINGKPVVEFWKEVEEKTGK